MKFFLLVSITLVCSTTFAQTTARTYKLDGTAAQNMPSSNSVSQILLKNGVAYLATNKGLNVSTDGGVTFRTDWGTDGPTGVGTNALAVKGDTIVVAVSTSMDQDGNSLPVGQGLYFSTDNGATWTHEPQSIDSLSDSTVVFGKNVLRALPITTAVNNISYSLVFHKGYLYAADFAGGLRRSGDLGKTWQRVVMPPDYLDYITQNPDSTYHFQLSPIAGKLTTETNYNHEAFSLFSDGDSVLYVGTADGIDRTTDNGYSWYKLNHQNHPGISGDFVVWIAGQNYDNEHNIWAATVNAVDSTEVEALSYTGNDGATWHTILPGHFFHSVGFNGNVVYGASDDGLFRTSDFGRITSVLTSIYDPTNNQSILSKIFYSVDTESDSVWLGTADGTAIGIDHGAGFVQSDWRVLRTFTPVGASNSTYFYPNPFSPNLDIGRIHYDVKKPGSTVTIRIYDFSMHIVKTLLQNASRPEGETDDVWDGKDDSGKLVDNGVYFYSVAINNEKPIWGKILVVR